MRPMDLQGKAWLRHCTYQAPHIIGQGRHHFEAPTTEIGQAASRAAKTCAASQIHRCAVSHCGVLLRLWAVERGKAVPLPQIACSSHVCAVSVFVSGGKQLVSTGHQSFQTEQWHSAGECRRPGVLFLPCVMHTIFVSVPCSQPDVCQQPVHEHPCACFALLCCYVHVCPCNPWCRQTAHWWAEQQ